MSGMVDDTFIPVALEALGLDPDDQTTIRDQFAEDLRKVADALASQSPIFEGPGEWTLKVTIQRAQEEPGSPLLVKAKTSLKMPSRRRGGVFAMRLKDGEVVHERAKQQSLPLVDANGPIPIKR